MGQMYFKCVELSHVYVVAGKLIFHHPHSAQTHVQSSSVVLSFWSQCEEAAATRGSGRLTACYRRFVLPTTIAARFIAAHRTALTSRA